MFSRESPDEDGHAIHELGPREHDPPNKVMKARKGIVGGMNHDEFPPPYDILNDYRRNFLIGKNYVVLLELELWIPKELEVNP